MATTLSGRSLSQEAARKSDLQTDNLYYGTSPLVLSEEQYEILRQKLLILTGIELGKNKQILMKSRLYKRLMDLKLSNFKDYINYLEVKPIESIHFINSMTTNKTDWFREPRHFSFLIEKILPEFYRRPTSNTGHLTEKMFYLWSAACSTGEEIYSLAMATKEHLKPGYDFRILGTDIDTQVILKATEAIYKSQHVRGQVPSDYQQKYFLQNRTNKNLFKICPELMQKVKIRQFNLIESEFPTPILFDVIFLRNVLIYFSKSTLESVIRRVIKSLRPGGYLIIGLSESLNGLKLPLINVSESVYQLKV